MNFNFMCLGVDLTPDMQKAQDIILKDFSQAYAGDFQFVNYGSEKSFIDGLSKAVEKDDIIVLTVQAELYMAFKQFIANRFKFKVKPQRTIQRLIVGTYPELDKEVMLKQASMPIKADVMISEDGLYSGYAIRTDTQIMFVLPLDPTRLDFLLEDGVFPYLRDNLDVSSVQDGDSLDGVQPLGKKKKSKKPKKAKKKAWNGVPQKDSAASAKEPTEELDAEAIRAAAAAESAEEAAEAASGPAFEAEYNKDYIQGVIDKLRLHKTVVAVADTKTVDFLKRMAADGVDYSEVVEFSDYSLERKKKDAAEYVAKLSKGAFEKTESKLGAAITKVYSKIGEDGTREYNIYVSVSDGKTAEEAKVTGEKGETPPQLINRAIEVLFHMIALWDERENTEAEALAEAEAAEVTEAPAENPETVAEPEPPVEPEPATEPEAEAPAEAEETAKPAEEAKESEAPKPQPQAAPKVRYPKRMSKADRKAAQAKAEREAAKAAWKPKD